MKFAWAIATAIGGVFFNLIVLQEAVAKNFGNNKKTAGTGLRFLLLIGFVGISRVREKCYFK